MYNNSPNLEYFQAIHVDWMNRRTRRGAAEAGCVQPYFGQYCSRRMRFSSLPEASIR